jgi:hypothetical protein
VNRRHLKGIEHWKSAKEQFLKEIEYALFDSVEVDLHDDIRLQMRLLIHIQRQAYMTSENVQIKEEDQL